MKMSRNIFAARGVLCSDVGHPSPVQKRFIPDHDSRGMIQ